MTTTANRPQQRFSRLRDLPPDEAKRLFDQIEAKAKERTRPIKYKNIVTGKTVWLLPGSTRPYYGDEPPKAEQPKSNDPEEVLLPF